jgi:hypothetical protein
MRYSKHDFFGNFINDNTDGYNISRDMIISEIAKAIEGKSVDVKDAIFECGIDINPNSSLDDVANVLSGNLGKSKCLQDKMASIVIDNNLTQKNLEYFNSNGNWGEFFSSPAFAQTLGTVIGATFGAVKQKQQAKELKSQREYELELARINAEALKNQMAMASTQGYGGEDVPPPPPNVGKIVLWSVVGIGVLVGGYFLVKKMKSKQS